MLQPKTYTVVFSFVQPEAVLHTLLPVLHQLQELPTFKSSRVARQQSRTLLLIDEQRERSQWLVRLLGANGYEVQSVGKTVDAFTLCLRENVAPLAILLGVEQQSDRFFLTRLLQQLTQKYGWSPMCLYMHTANEVIPQSRQLPQRVQPRTDPLPQLMPTPMPESALPAPDSTVRQDTASHRRLRLPSPQSTPLVRAIVSALPAAPIAPIQSRSQAEKAPLPTQQANASSTFAVSDVSTAPTAPVFTVSPARSQLSQTHSIANDEPVHVTIENKKVSLTGLSIGRYHMQTLLGNGPLGEVYRTYDRLREYDVALKAVQLDAIPSYINSQDMTSDTNLLQQELDLLSTCNHPHILMPLGVGKSYISGSPFVYKTMRYCTAGSLAAWLYKLGNVNPLSLQEVVRVVMQVADALHTLHKRLLTYQNFKLSNLLIRDEVSHMSQCHIVLSDFPLFQNGTFLLKTPAIYPYMAPERWQGTSHPASDQYGLAAIAYELLTGRPPFSGQSEHVVRQLHQTMQPQAPSTLSSNTPPTVDAVILRALAKRSEDRYPSVMAFAEALQKRSI